jgi:hypothetical protein
MVFVANSYTSDDGRTVWLEVSVRDADTRKAITRLVFFTADRALNDRLAEAINGAMVLPTVEDIAAAV